MIVQSGNFRLQHRGARAVGERRTQLFAGLLDVHFGLAQLLGKLLLIQARGLLGQLQLRDGLALRIDLAFRRNSRLVQLSQIMRERVQSGASCGQRLLALHAHGQCRLQTIVMIVLLKLLQFDGLLFKVGVQNFQLLLGRMLVVLNIGQPLR